MAHDAPMPTAQPAIDVDDESAPSTSTEGRARLTLVRDGSSTSRTFSAARSAGPNQIPLGALQPGDVVELRADERCAIGGSRPLRARIEIGPEAPLPATLGTLRHEAHTGSLTIASSGGACSEAKPATYVDVTVTLSPEARPWRSLLSYRTSVDGRPYEAATTLGALAPYGESWMGRGRDRVFAGCTTSTEGGVSAAEHVIVMHATVPGTDIDIQSAPLTVDLRCPASESPSTPTADLYDTIAHNVWVIVIALQIALIAFFLVARKRRVRRRRR